MHVLITNHIVEDKRSTLPAMNCFVVSINFLAYKGPKFSFAAHLDFKRSPVQLGKFRGKKLIIVCSRQTVEKILLK